MKHTITLFRGRNGWMARYTDPQVIGLFASDTIPTAYTNHTNPEDVLRNIQRLNPDCIVTIEE